MNFCYVPQHAVPPSTDFHLGHIVVVLRRSHALVTSSSPSTRHRAERTHPRPQLDQEYEGRHRAERVQIAEVSCISYLIGWIAKTFDYINRVTKRFRFRSTRVRRHTLPSRCYASPDRSCVIVGNFLKYCVPQHWAHSSPICKPPLTRN